jgi:pyruvate-formate lyase-activating enzyme
MTVVGLGVPSVQRPLGAAPKSGPLIDTFGRVATDLRVSLTDRCNLRCTYCMPAEGLDWLPREQLLRADELTRLLSIAVTRLGITSVRFTGGEPMVAKHLEDVVAATAGLRPRPEITLTTNGIGLDKRAAKLKTAGLDRINVSLDTVDAAHFAHITRRDRLADVLAGLQAAKDAGLDPVKVNAVLDPVTGLDDAVALLRFCLDHGYQLRIIEQMPLDAGHEWQRGRAIEADDVLAAPRHGRRHRLGVARVLLGLRPHPAHRRRPGPQLPVRPAGDRSARSHALGRRRRRDRGGLARRDVGQGGGPRHQRPGLRAAGPADERDRWVGDVDDHDDGARDRPLFRRCPCRRRRGG